MNLKIKKFDKNNNNYFFDELYKLYNLNIKKYKKDFFKYSINKLNL